MFSERWNVQDAASVHPGCLQSIEFVPAVELQKIVLRCLMGVPTRISIPAPWDDGISSWKTTQTTRCHTCELVELGKSDTLILFKVDTSRRGDRIGAGNSKTIEGGKEHG